MAQFGLETLGMAALQIGASVDSFLEASCKKKIPVAAHL